ncbi:uncharacterized protein [Nicotiana tomentosiformis]|uniref:uncharacterized protein n=1 Tax=Nicotiana tomentosiformis TaxID=4098 RepID=UPI00388CDFAE
MTLGNIAVAKFDEVVDSARWQEMVRIQEHEERESKRSHGPGNSGSVPSRGQSYHNRGRPYRPARMARPAHCGASTSHGSYSALPSQSSLSALLSQSSSRAPSERGCFECGELGHMKRYCPRLSGGPVQQRSQATTPAPIILPSVQPARGGAHEARGLPRGGGRSGDGRAQFYVVPTRPEIVASDTSVTSIVLVGHKDASNLFDPGCT